MTAATTIKTWYLVHKWTSLVCTVFLLVICLTGLPLIFHHEIEDLFDEGKPVATLPEGTPPASLDKIVEAGRWRALGQGRDGFAFVEQVLDFVMKNQR